MPDERLSTRQLVWDIALGCVCLTIALVQHLSGTEAVARNLAPSWFSVVVTSLAVAPVVVRRLFPLPVLILTLLGLLLLVATHNTVAVATLGCTIAFYTAIGAGPRRNMRIAIAVMAVGVIIGLLMRPVDLSPSGAASTLTIFVGAGILGLGVRQRRQRYEAEVEATRARAARSVAEDRLQIARDLHDIIGHAMSVMVVQAGVAERLLDTSPEQARAAVGQIGSTGRTSLAEMRQVLGAFRDPDEPDAVLPRQPMPGLADVPALVSRVRAAGLDVTLTVDGAGAGLPQGIELVAYRVIQEGLTNCLRHASATYATVTVTQLPDNLQIEIINDGHSRPSGKVGGRGLVGMRERVAAYGGQVTAGPVADGFRVVARLRVPPLDTRSPELTS